jgi:hypothetical protein
MVLLLATAATAAAAAADKPVLPMIVIGAITVPALKR